MAYSDLTVVIQNTRKLKTAFRILPLLALCLSLSTCNQKNSGKILDTPTSGAISIATDESFQPIIAAQIAAFEAIYKKAKVNAVYVSEGEAFQHLLQDSARIVIATRDLNETEKQFFKAKNITPKLLKVAIDGVTLILNKQNEDSLFTLSQLKKIFSGEYGNWNMISGKKNTSKINIVFDKAESSNLNYIKTKFDLSDSLEKRVFAAGSNLKVIEYVKSHPNAIGVIGVNWISDSDDPKHKSFRKVVRVAGIASSDDKDEQEFFQPYQAYLAQNQYPLSRELYIISREARAGLGTGFSAWVASDKGQRIFLMSGLLPATQPIRIVSVTKKNPLAD